MPARPALVVGASYLAGAVPVSNVAARLRKGVDLRSVGGGTVSGTGLYEVAGFGTLAVAGCVEVAKGALGPLLAGGDRTLAALAAGAAVAGHDWSIFLRGAGGRGLSVAMGSLLVTAPEGTLLLAAGLAGGRLAGETALGALLAVASLPALLGARRGRDGVVTAAALLLPLLAKRLAGNRRPPERTWRAYRERLLYDRDA